MAELRHYARRSVSSGQLEIVDREFDWVRVILPYNYAYTSNAQQWGEAERICRALEGSMSAQGIVNITKPPTDEPKPMGADPSAAEGA